jgi:hypothetical protein
LQFAETLTIEEINQIAADPKVKVLQTFSVVDSQTWDLLNEHLFLRRPDIQLRVYGRGPVYDLSFATKLTNVRRFSADSLTSAIGLEHLASMVNLEALSIGISDLKSFDFLNNLPTTLSSLFLTATKSKKLSLKPLSRFTALRELYLEGQQNGIEAMASLQQLEDLTLRSISTPDVEYLAALPRLRTLDIKLGGMRDLSALMGKTSIQYLELWQIRGLHDISFISSLTGLQFLFLQSLPSVIQFPDLSKLTKLRRIYLENLKALVDLNGISGAPALEEFIHVDASNLKPEHYDEILKMPSLKQISVGFGSTKKNQLLRDKAQRAGKSEHTTSKFIFE